MLPLNSRFTRSALAATRDFIETRHVATALMLIVGIAIFLRFIDLERAGLANLFYASSIRSMGLSWHHFFYAAFDPAATISVDKPPFALWLQVLSSKIFGFNGVALILPVAIAGVLGVLVTYALGRRSHGIYAGLLAALFLAVFPESVATSRDTTMDAFIMLLLGLAAWQLIIIVEDRRRWLLVSFAATLGIAFNVKFFQAFVILPAATVYLMWRYRGNIRELIAPLAVASIVGATIALSWIAFVDLTPAESRPLVMNDASNSAMGLAFRYNGIERVISPESNPLVSVIGSSGTRRALGKSARYGIGGSGPLRLLTPSNGALLGFGICLALGGIFIVLMRNRFWLFEGPGLFWSLWLLTGVTFFSISHRAPAHYTESYVPAIAVMAAVGLIEAWRASGPILRIAVFNKVPASLMLPSICGLLLIYAGVIYSRIPTIGLLVLVTSAMGGITLVLSVLPSIKRTPMYSTVANSFTIASIFAVMLITSLWIALEAPRGGQITNPNPITYLWHKSLINTESLRVPTLDVLERYANTLPQAKYRFAISSINDAGEAIANTGASVLPIWNNYTNTPVLSNEKLNSLILSKQVPVVLVYTSLENRKEFSKIRNLLSQHCHSATFPALGSAWSLWDCHSP
ncbi:MAG: glycosyltransferase family 39 protein [Pseudomonadales bacterium]|nr:glycosyltransferase family 39 protein [Pseudomonadales bacterium]